MRQIKFLRVGLQTKKGETGMKPRIEIAAINLSTFILGMFLLWGCASSGTVQTIKPVSGTLADYQRLAVEVNSDIVDSKKEVSQLQELIVDKLQESNLFEKIVGRDMADLLLKAKIVGLRQVGAGERIMAGVFAGKAKVTADVELIDLKTNNAVSSFRAESQLLWGGTKDTLKDLTEKIVGFIQENYKKSEVKKSATEYKQSPKEAQPDIKSSTTAKRLQKLKELREQGLITDEEYQKKRSEILQEL